MDDKCEKGLNLVNVQFVYETDEQILMKFVSWQFWWNTSAHLIFSGNQTTVRNILLEDRTCVSVHMLNILIYCPVFIRKKKKIFRTEVAEKNEPHF